MFLWTDRQDFKKKPFAAKQVLCFERCPVI